MKKVLRALLPILVLAGGVWVYHTLVTTRPSAPRETPEERAEPVETMTLQATTGPVVVQATGTVKPARVLTVQPEVSGRVVELNDSLIPGGRISAGEVLLRIDSRDYDLQVAQRRADLARVRLELDLEQGRRAVAEREWQLLDDEIETTESGRELALRRPHERSARAALMGAQSALEQARLLASRTTIESPMNAVVRDENVALGQLVAPQSQIATLVGTDRFLVETNVPTNDLGWLDLPELGVAQGSRAKLYFEVSPGNTVVREGRAVRLLPQLEPAGRMAQVVVEVVDPLEVTEASPGAKGPLSLPLLLNAYVRVELFGPTLEGIFEVPRSALRDGDRVWLMNDSSRLEIRRVEVSWRDPSSVWVSNGLEPGEQLITSRLSTPIPGMALRPIDSAPSAEQEALP